MGQQQTSAREPTPAQLGIDRCFRGLTFGFAWFTILVVVLMIWQIGHQAAPAIEKNGLEFLTSSKWDSNREQFGILPQIWGTLYSSILGVALGTLFGVAVAIFITQDF